MINVPYKTLIGGGGFVKNDMERNPRNIELRTCIDHLTVTRDQIMYEISAHKVGGV